MKYITQALCIYSFAHRHPSHYRHLILGWCTHIHMNMLVGISINPLQLNTQTHTHTHKALFTNVKWARSSSNVLHIQRHLRYYGFSACLDRGKKRWLYALRLVFEVIHVFNQFKTLVHYTWFSLFHLVDFRFIWYFIWFEFRFFTRLIFLFPSHWFSLHSIWYSTNDISKLCEHSRFHNESKW